MAAGVVRSPRPSPAGLLAVAYAPRGGHRRDARLGLFITTVRGGYHGGWRVLQATAQPYDRMNGITEAVNLKLLRAVCALAVVGGGWFAGIGATATPRIALSRTASGHGEVAVRRRPELDTWSADPRLGVNARTNVSVHVSDAGPEIGEVTLYVPAGYGFDPTVPPGTKEGRVYMLTGSDIGVGQLTAVDPASYDDTPEAQVCAPGAHAAVWAMPLDFLISSQRAVVPVYLDPTTGAETALGAYKLQTCLPLAIIPSPGGWPIGMRLRNLTFEFTRFTNPDTAATYVWRAFVSEPDGSGDPDLSTTQEVRSDMALAADLTLTGRFDRKHSRVVLSGRLTTQTLPTGGIRVALFRVGPHGARRHVATTQTSANGSYHFVRSMAETSTYVTEASGIGDCTGRSTAPRGCVDETRGAIDSSKNRVVARVGRTLSAAG